METDKLYGRYCHSIACSIPSNREDSEEGVSNWNKRVQINYVHIGFTQLLDKLVFVGMSAAQYLPPGGKVAHRAPLAPPLLGELAKIFNF